MSLNILSGYLLINFLLVSDFYFQSLSFSQIFTGKQQTSIVWRERRKQSHLSQCSVHLSRCGPATFASHHAICDRRALSTTSSPTCRRTAKHLCHSIPSGIWGDMFWSYTVDILVWTGLCKFVFEWMRENGSVCVCLSACLSEWESAWCCMSVCELLHACLTQWEDDV